MSKPILKMLAAIVIGSTAMYGCYYQLRYNQTTSYLQNTSTEIAYEQSKNALEKYKTIEFPFNYNPGNLGKKKSHRSVH